MAKKKTPSSSDVKKFTSQTLKSGSKGPAVGYLQDQLNQNGAKIDVDEQFGPGTKGAVKSFQKKKKLDVDGIVGPKTWEAFTNKSPKPEPKQEKKEKEPANKPSKDECVVKLRVMCPASRQGKMPVQGAKVTIKVKNKDVKKRTATNGDVTFNLPPGLYDAEIVKTGFQVDKKDPKPIQIRAIAGGVMDLEVDMKESK